MRKKYVQLPEMPVATRESRKLPTTSQGAAPEKALSAASGSGFVAFSPLAQGLLTGRYLDGIPQDSRMAAGRSLQREVLTDAMLERLRALNDIARQRGQTLAEMALAWLLRDKRVTSVIVGASSAAQIEDNLRALENASFSDDELARIDALSRE